MHEPIKVRYYINLNHKPEERVPVRKEIHSPKDDKKFNDKLARKENIVESDHMGNPLNGSEEQGEVIKCFGELSAVKKELIEAHELIATLDIQLQMLMVDNNVSERPEVDQEEVQEVAERLAEIVNESEDKSVMKANEQLKKEVRARNRRSKARKASAKAKAKASAKA